MCTTAEKPAERRQHNRLEPRDRIFAVVACDPITLREVTDVSLTGLRLCCFVDDKLPAEPFSLALVREDGMLLDTISARTTWSAPVHRGSSESGQRWKQCGVRFDEPMPEQISRLKTFIERDSRHG